MSKWKFLAHGTRPGETIVCTRTSGGLIHRVASAYPSHKGYMYKLYPVNYQGHTSIEKPTTASIHNVDLNSGPQGTL